MPDPSGTDSKRDKGRVRIEEVEQKVTKLTKKKSVVEDGLHLNLRHDQAKRIAFNILGRCYLVTVSPC